MDEYISTVLIEISDGCVQSVASDNDRIRVLILDWDDKTAPLPIYRCLPGPLGDTLELASKAAMQRIGQGYPPPS